MKKTLLIVLAIAILVTICACTVDVRYADPVVTQITIDGITDTEYVACDALDISDAIVVATYDNGEIKRVPLEKSMLDSSSYDMDTPGTYAVKVNYGGVSTTFSITVVSWELVSVELNSHPYVTEYIVGEEIDTTGASIRCTFAGDKVKIYTVTKDMLQTYDNNTPGVKPVYFTYRGVEMYFDVTFYEKTPIGIKIIDDASDNYVYKGLGNNYNIEGMTVKVTYDNMQSPEFVATDLEEDIFIQIDDTSAGTVTAVLMYYPSDYLSQYSYVFYGQSKVKVGDIVKPLTEIASNKFVRDGKEIALDPIVSKSYGTVKSIVNKDDGSVVITIDTAISYALTRVDVKVGDIIDASTHIGMVGTISKETDGGGVVEEIENGVVTIRTAPTVSFTSNVKNKSFVSIEILDYPKPEKYFGITTINNMIQGDTIDRSTGRVRVSYDDESYEDFYMNDENNIHVINAGKDSVNTTLDISSAGRHELWVCYGGVLTNRTTMWVNVEGKYPVSLEIEETSNTINEQTFYFGDTISIATMRYYVIFNNETESEREHVTTDMLGEGCSFYCAEQDNEYTGKIFFTLPQKYSALIPTDEEGVATVINSQEFSYHVKPQPITGISFVDKPSKVYVSSVENISYENSLLNVYYRNNTYVSLKEFNSIEYKAVETWEEIEEYEPNTGDTDARAVVFTLESNSVVIDIDEILKGNGYQAKMIYFDEYGCRSTPTEFTYYLMDSNYEVESIKVDLLTYDGMNYYKDEYAQYEDWDLSGVTLKVTYKETAQTSIIEATPNMIYDSSTSYLGTDLPVKFTYLGVTDEDTLKISVKERKPTEIKIVEQGQTEYLETYNGGIKFDNYKFELSYNAGPNQPISNLNNLKTKELSSGWWYKMYNDRGEEIEALFNQSNETGIVYFELYFSYLDASAEKGYSYVATPSYRVIRNALKENPNAEESIYTVNVVANTYTVTSISYDLNVIDENGIISHNVTHENFLNKDTKVLATFPSGGNTNVLAEVAAGWEIMLSEYVNGEVKNKVLTVHYVDSEGVESTGLVNITKEMINYNTLDTSTGYRRATITYKNKTCNVYIYVWTAELTEVEVFRTPLQNYIYSSISDESDLDLTGGVIMLTFSKYTRKGVFEGFMYKYVDMKSEDVTYSGFIDGLYSKTGEKISINVLYKNYTDLETFYVITLYDRQDVVFSYTNTIFFYGNVSDANYTAYKTIDEFSLPNKEDIALRYVPTQSFITIQQYLALSQEEKENYVSITTYDKNEKLAQVLFMPENQIFVENYIDPAPGEFYVRYGNVAMIEERFYNKIEDETLKEKFVAVTIGDKVNYYTFDTSVVGENINWYEEVIIDKLSVEEFNNLSAEDKANYELVNNEYYIMMRVVDDRDLDMRYYETANYVLQTYTIIQKVIEVGAVAPSTNVRLLRISTTVTDEQSNIINGNPYAILYLLNPNTLTTVCDGLRDLYPYISDILITSPNMEYFEILIKLTTTITAGDSREDGLVETMFTIMSALTNDDMFNSAMIKMGLNVRIATVEGINIATGEKFTFNANNKDAMTTEIKSKWQTSVNVISELQFTEDNYHISYSVAYGETLTRNGVLQVLAGNLVVAEVYDENNVKVGYVVKIGTLGHSSYTVDLTTTEVDVIA